MKRVGKKKIPTLSAAMMVKNESENLHRCLKSIRGIVDEIVVVDTGSTDDSMDICKSYGAKVYEHPWENNFALHRNQSIGYATGDFILIIDADEELVITHKGSESIQEWLGNWPDNVQFAKMHLFDIQNGRKAMEFNPPRIFRNGAIKYDAIVHNKPIVEHLDYCYLVGASIYHYGYDLSPEKKQIKLDRTRSLLMKRIDENPKDAEAYYYLSQNSDWGGEKEDAIKWAKKFLETIDGVDKKEHVYYKSIYVTIAKNYMQLKDYDNCRKWLMRGLKEYPEDMDIIFLTADFAFTVNDATLGMKAAGKFVHMFDTFTNEDMVKNNAFIYSYNNSCLSTCLYHMAAGHLCEASNNLKRLEESTLDVSDDFKAKIIHNMEAVLTKHGFRLIQEEEPQKGKVVLLSDARTKKAGDKPRLAILDPMNNKFAGSFKDYFTAKGYDVKLLGNSNLAEAMKWPDVVLSLWANEPLVTLTKQGGSIPPIITYLRSYEMLTPQLMEEVDWNYVNGIIFVANHIQDLTNKYWGEMVTPIPQTVVNNFVKLKDYAFNNSGAGTDIAYIGYLNHKKGLSLLWQCLDRLVKWDSNTILHVAGSYQEVRFKEYTEHLLDEMGLTKHVIFHDWVKDIPGFLQDKNFVISTSPWEGCPNNVIEAMACGVKPLVHNWRGAKELFGEEHVFNTVDEMMELFTGQYNAQKLRAYVGERFNSKLQLPKVKAFMDQYCARAKEASHAAKN